MKGQRIPWQLLPILLASAALAFAQANGSSMRGTPWQAPNVNRQASPSEPVGPGTINYVEGQVSLSGQDLTPQSVGTATLRPGQVLDTGDGYVEVLLTPGAFLRVGHNSEVRMMSAGLADTRAELVHGASIVEVDQMIKGTNLAVVINGTTTRIEKNGLYDFDAAQQAVMVLDGKANVQEPTGAKTLGKHDEIQLASGHPLKRRAVNEKAVQAEPLYVWSKARSEDEAQASDSAARNADAYMAMGPGWYWDPAWGFYGFWPADYAMFSPYGWGFYSPAFFGFGYYGGGFYGGAYHSARWYGHPGQYGRGGWTGAHLGGGHARVGGMNARVGAFRTGGFSHSVGGGFRGGMGGGGFHSGGGSHGGGGRR